MTRLQRAMERRRAALERLNRAADAIDQAADDADLEPLEEELSAAEAELEAADGDVTLAERIEAARRAAPAPDNPEETHPERREIRVGAEERTYRPDTPERSYLLDIARRDIRRDAEASERLARHGREVADDVTRRQAAQTRALEDGLQTLLRDAPAPLRRAIEDRGILDTLVQRRAVNRIPGTGGDFIPPLYLLDEYAEYARSGRPFADSLRNIPLPGGVDTISVPRILAGAEAAAQTGDGAAVHENDMTTGTVTAPVRTIAGQQTIPQQLLDQSPVAFDQLVFGELLADYAVKVNVACWSGSGAAGEVLGLLNTPGIQTVTYTDGAPTLPALYPKFWAGVNAVETSRKRSPDATWVAGRRYNWIASRLDAQNRPFVVPVAQGPSNAVASQVGVPGPEGPALNIGGHLAYKDLSMPTDLGGSINEDRVVVTHSPDHVLFEGDVRVRALTETKGDTLQVVLQAYGYAAVTFGRFPASTAVIAGTGLATPTF